jgi:hypothetical protein
MEITHAALSNNDFAVANAPRPGTQLACANDFAVANMQSRLKKAAHIGMELFEANQDLQNQSNMAKEDNEHLKQDRLDRQNVLLSDWMDELEKEVVPQLKKENKSLQSEIQSISKANILLKLRSEEVEYHHTMIVERNTKQEQTIGRLELIAERNTKQEQTIGRLELELEREKQKRKETEAEMMLLVHAWGKAERVHARPPPKSPNTSGNKPLQAGWKAVVDQKCGETYYYNKHSRVTTWERHLIEQ